MVSIVSAFDVFNIPYSYISRNSNAEVLEITQSIPLQYILLKHQLLLYRKIALRSNDDPIRALAMQSSSCSPLQNSVKRRRGRPIASWIDQVHKHVLLIHHHSLLLSQLVNKFSFMYWRDAVNKYIQSISTRSID